MSSDGGWLEVVGAAASVLSAGTAFVAALSAAASKRSADEAQQSALKAWQQTAQAASEANELRKATAEAAARRLRIPFARELKSYGNAFLAKRVAGMTIQQALQDDIQDTTRIDTLMRLQSEADDPTAMTITKWAADVYHSAELQRGDFSRMLLLSQRIQDRVDMWIDNPKVAADMCNLDLADASR